MIEDKFNPEKLEWKGDKKNVVRRVATLNYVESVSEIDPPRVEEFPKQRATVFVQIPQVTIPLGRHVVPVNVNPLDHFMTLHGPLLPRAQYGDSVAIRLQCDGFFPNAGVPRNGGILDDDENLFFHDQSGSRLEELVKSRERT